MHKECQVKCFSYFVMTIIITSVLSATAAAETPLSVEEIRDIHCAGIDKQIQRRDESYWRFVESKKVAAERFKAAREEQPRDYEKIQEIQAEMRSASDIASKWSAKIRESLIFKYTVCSLR